MSRGIRARVTIMSQDKPPGRGASQSPIKTSLCPTCGGPPEHRFRPFCSQRCRDVDLGRWLRGSYRIPSDETPGQAATGEASSDDDEPPFGLGGGA